jgi:hypothetical protein
MERTMGFADPLSENDDESFRLQVAAVLSKRGAQSDYVASLMMQKKYREIFDFVPDYRGDLEDFRGATQIQALIKKARNVDAGYNRRKNAVEAVIAAELQCGRVNRYFGSLCPFGGVQRVVSLARRKIAWVLGDVPALSKLQGSFGPGATTNVKKREACWEAKLTRGLVCSEEMLPHVDRFLKETPCWSSHSSEWKSVSRFDEGRDSVIESGWVSPVAVDVGRLIFVEKNAKTDRPIVVEPILNGFWQLAVGSYLKKRLRVHANQDLTSQVRNQEMARRGSIDGSLATIDLSSASDTIAFSVVFDLLPEPWVDFLNSMRTGSVAYETIEIELEKFSSMGNGYTFELESLIFWALSAACVSVVGCNESDVTVYGDDIIVPTPAVDLLYATLTWCGFNVNTEKSFTSGPFRESCGADWLNGEDVRPFFKKDTISVQNLFVTHNWMMRRGERELAKIAESFIPPCWRMYGPDGYGDGHLLGSYDLKQSRRDKRRGWEAGYFESMAETPALAKTNQVGRYLAGVYSMYASPPSGDNIRHLAEGLVRTPGVIPGGAGFKARRIYTFSEHIFVPSKV